MNINVRTESVITLAQKLIQQPSITSTSCNCHKIINNYLQQLNFKIEFMKFKDTINIWAYHNGNRKNKYIKTHTLLFLGHTDVVTPGTLKNWKYPPFSGVIHDNILYGRGAADMKGALAAMLIAAKNFVHNNSDYPGKIAFLITSDEEGKGTNGTIKVVQSLLKRNEKINYCIVGEPTSQNKIGDVIKNGRRGSLTATLTILGIQGHVAYPQFSKNPIHSIIPAISDLLNTKWDQINNTLFPETTMQITNIISNNNNNNNIIPNEVTLQINLRFNTLTSVNNIKKQIHKILQSNNLNYNINWQLHAEPYFSKPGKFTNIVINIIKDSQKFTPVLETTGGTSDGRFVAKMGSEIIELGALNCSIHKFNEHIHIKDLKILQFLYQEILEKLFINASNLL
ncbi:succinyl-diaminopimelate desuccinylase [Candidatus Blochmannia ocreatus (nom. nud.)]|uniref:Succinyl-diaminopimelate desuccinylase n=1 Tax=Candidatus Blochmannia ocreatus (nom. nud.) TaxID=251538 RepID=A0ABY4SUD1_9ENTR|nr:succinyl-diaminopimelate desuccinylase [Candidatus Blochmannia ocreatus]URJ24999.1 succinyl-diaminopimelate desuccinylase [Candidatus Blochmannia ocreatus]